MAVGSDSSRMRTELREDKAGCQGDWGQFEDVLFNIQLLLTPPVHAL